MMLKDENGIPRRSRLDLLEPAEKAIYNAMQEVEKIGADERLTNAIVKLQEAKELVSDYIDEKKSAANESSEEQETGGDHPGHKPQNP